MSKTSRPTTSGTRTGSAIRNVLLNDYVPEESVIYLVRRVLSLETRELERELEPLELTSAQWSPLFKLRTGLASTVGELARECEQDAGSMTRLLDRLEAKGLCNRNRSASDRRSVNIGLTQRGREVASRIPEVLNRIESTQLAGFSVEEVEALKGLLKRIILNARE